MLHVRLPSRSELYAAPGAAVGSSADVRRIALEFSSLNLMVDIVASVLTGSFNRSNPRSQLPPTPSRLLDDAWLEDRSISRR